MELSILIGTTKNRKTAFKLCHISRKQHETESQSRWLESFTYRIDLEGVNHGITVTRSVYTDKNQQTKTQWSNIYRTSHRALPPYTSLEANCKSLHHGQTPKTKS